MLCKETRESFDTPRSGWRLRESATRFSSSPFEMISSLNKDRHLRKSWYCSLLRILCFTYNTKTLSPSL